MQDWQTIGTIASTFGVIVALIAFAYEIRMRRDERRFDTFVRFLDAYESQRKRRNTTWQKVREVLRRNERTANEVDERRSIVDYLVLRASQLESMYPVEHELLEEEIRSLNIVNELCRLAAGDENRTALLSALLSSEIYYYQNRLSEIQELRDFQRRYRIFSIVRDSWLIKFDVRDFIDKLPG